MSDKSKGLYSKYIVVRKDGRGADGEKHHNCSYFVLDLDHDPYAINAIRAYAVACEREYPALARDIKKIVTRAIAAAPKPKV